jgi:2-keto-3-deoxy-6-phosphogluconate aldolase
LQALAAPFGEVRFCPTGGVTEQTAQDWLAIPQVLCVGGTWLVPRGPVDPPAIRAAAERASSFARSA